MAIAGSNPLSNQTIQIPAPLGLPIKDTEGCPAGQKCIGQKLCTFIGCACLGVCVPDNGAAPVSPIGPFPGGPAPPPTPTPPVAQPAPQLGGCPPRVGQVAPAILCPAGCHPNKSDYFLKDGQFIPRGTRCVRNRRRNPLNPRALDRALSRVCAAKKASKALGRVTVRKKPSRVC